MCGYVRRHIGPKSLKEFLELLGVQGYYDEPENDEPELKHFYPAHGKAVNRTIDGIIINEDGQLKYVTATWWYHCEEKNGELKVGYKTTFNARNLHLEFWRDAISKHRAIVVATGIGEGKKDEYGKDHHYLVTSDRIMLLGAVYQKFPSGKYSCAIITRDEHPRFERYHDKAFPLFLPHNLAFLKLWLSDVGDDHPQIAALLGAPRIFADLTITPVKTFKAGVPVGPTEFLQADTN